jgi:oligoribonuclease (3'-5' exoribonuclease)
MLIKPNFSLDLETTGLDTDKAQILEIACVYDDGVSPIEDLPKYREIFRPKSHYYEPYAMSMHSALLEELAAGGGRSGLGSFYEFLEEHGGKDKITFSGKNLTGFDLAILKREGFDWNYSHRSIDVGSVYFHKFGYVPSLGEINELIGYKPVSHKALDDALNVIAALRWIMREEDET